ncbi:MAG: transcription termination factor NusA [Planctomycetia bacterium]
MDPADIVRLADVVHRDRGIEKETVFVAIEEGLMTAARRKYGDEAVIELHLDRKTGHIDLRVDGEPKQMSEAEFGRIAAQTARQVMSTRIREAERDTNLGEWERRVGTIVTGSIQRIEGGNLIVNMGRVEGIVPRSEQIRTEQFKVGDRIRAFCFEVRPMGHRVRIVLSRSRPDFVKELFKLEVPEIGENVIKVHAIEREAGYKTKLAVVSVDPKVDPIGACVGVRGSRIRNVIDELNGEKVDILPWVEQPEEMISTALKPATINSITLDYESKSADVLVDEDQLSLAIGRRGANVRLASRLSGWEINITGEKVPGAPAAGGEAPPAEGAAPAAADGAAPAEPASPASEPPPAAGQDAPPSGAPEPA